MSKSVSLALCPNVPSFGWLLRVESGGSTKHMSIAYSPNHKQLVVSSEDMASLSGTEISAIEEYEVRMIEHMNECERRRALTNISMPEYRVAQD